MIFAEDPAGVAAWYAGWLGTDPAQLFPGGAAVVQVAGIELVFHPADPGKNPPGLSTVVYWRTEDLHRDVQRLNARGATVHRGPLALDAGRCICQLLDPWGNVIGLDGPTSRPS